jgi:hypothetical protein
MNATPKGGGSLSSYIIAYRGGGQPRSAEEKARGMARWQEWLHGLGDAVLDAGTPLGASRIVSAGLVSDAPASTRLTGFSIVEADSMESALEMARSCPFLEVGTLEVAEVLKMG